MGTNEMIELPDALFQYDQDAHALDRPTGGPRAPADEHEGEEQVLQEGRPFFEVGGGEPGGGYGSSLQLLGRGSTTSFFSLESR